MIIYILMVQRKCSYPGQYSPEAMECAEEYAHLENPDFLNKAMEVYKNSGEFDSLEIIPVRVDDKEIEKRLSKNIEPIDSEVI